MPFLTDYKCLECSHTWEVLLDSREDKVEACPKCGAKEVQRLIGGTITKLNDPEVLKETLKKRSSEHTLKEVKKHAGHKGTLPPNFGRTKMY